MKLVLLYCVVWGQIFIKTFCVSLVICACMIQKCLQIVKRATQRPDSHPRCMRVRVYLFEIDLDIIIILHPACICASYLNLVDFSCVRSFHIFNYIIYTPKITISSLQGVKGLMLASSLKP